MALTKGDVFVHCPKVFGWGDKGDDRQSALQFCLEEGEISVIVTETLYG